MIMVPFCSFDTILSKEDFNCKQNVIMNAIKFFMLHIVLSYHTYVLYVKARALLKVKWVHVLQRSNNVCELRKSENSIWK